MSEMWRYAVVPESPLTVIPRTSMRFTSRWLKASKASRRCTLLCSTVWVAE